VKIKFLISLIAFALTFSIVATGQRRRQPTAKPKAAPSPSPTPIPLSTLSIEAGLVYNNGDVKPVARTKFYLLDEDLAITLKPFDETPGTVGSELDLERTISTSESIDEEHRAKAKAKYDQIIAAIAAHTVATVTTDFSGKAKFESLTPGTKFLYGEFHIGKQRIAWNAQVDLKPGADTALTLDNNNRAY
jgi:hypothetical protein